MATACCAKPPVGCNTAADGAFLARVGGDEFTLIVTNGPQPETAKALSERLLAAFKDDFEIDGHRMQLGLSIGGAIYPTDGADAETLLANADAALYQAKAEMRGSVRFFDAELAARLRERRDLQNDLRAALNRGEFFLHYQPQQKIATEESSVSKRWCAGNVQNAAWSRRALLFRLPKRAGLIIPLGEWILREACREAASWPRPLKIAVNISPIQFHHGDLPRLVHSILLETGLAPDRLELEITEGVLIDDFSRAVSILRKLKSLGVQIAMDDFGSGYSSLSYLHAFPSTRSRSTAPSSAILNTIIIRWRSCARSSRSAIVSMFRSWPKVSRPKRNGFLGAGRLRRGAGLSDWPAAADRGLCPAGRPRTESAERNSAAG